LATENPPLWRVFLFLPVFFWHFNTYAAQPLCNPRPTYDLNSYQGSAL